MDRSDLLSHAIMCVTLGSPGRPYGFIMQDTDLVHFTTAVDTFHEPEQRGDRRQRGSDVSTSGMMDKLFLPLRESHISSRTEAKTLVNLK